MTRYICDDGGAAVAIEAASPKAAAQEYVAAGSWNDSDSTDWIDVYVQPDSSEIEARLAELIGEHDYSAHDTGWRVYDADDLDIEALRQALPECTLRLDGDGDLDVDHGAERECITVELEPPEPDCAGDHDHDWCSPHSVVGGIHGHGGGVVIREVCAHCGRYRITDTWAQRSDTGQQGLDSVAYDDADDASLAWVARRRFRDWSAEELVAEYGDIEVTEADSIAAGNCRDETERAAEIVRNRRGLEPDDEVTIADVLAVMPDSELARAACAAAAAR